MGQPSTLYQTIVAIRANFNRLKAAGDALHKDDGVTSAMRAVMESLADHGPQTVPEVARTKRVTRQHIQTLADQLAAAKLLTFKDNPAHKRSSLMHLTAKGERTFTAIRTREKSVLAELADLLPQRDLEITLRTLTRLQTALDSRLTLGEDDDSSD